VPYNADADRLLTHGQFRTDLPLKELADKLKVPPNSLAKPRSPSEVDPDAELFRAQVATLTKHAKELSRTMRRQQVREGRTPDAVFSEWDVTNYSFTLNRLKHPSDHEKAVLSAIIHARTPMPGDRIHAVGVASGELAPGRLALAAGMLPPQTQQQAAEELLGRP
jgi:hypothetical protein